MDAILRALARRFENEPTLVNAQEYIASLERTVGVPSGNPLMDIWGSLILGLLDPNGINLAVYDALIDLTTIIFGKEATSKLNDVVGVADDRFFLKEGSERWLNSFLKKIGYQCQIPRGCVSKPCAVTVYYGSTGGFGRRSAWHGDERCTCPGCYEYDADGEKYILCWHHYQMLQSGNGVNFSEALELDQD